VLIFDLSNAALAEKIIAAQKDEIEQPTNWIEAQSQ
jgi:uncharacterized protein (DUF305 family)